MDFSSPTPSAGDSVTMLLDSLESEADLESVHRSVRLSPCRRVRGARWIVPIGAAIALLGCGSDSADEARTAPTNAPVSTAAMTATTSFDSVVSPEQTSARPPSPKPTCETFYRTSVTLSPEDGPVLDLTTPGSAEASFDDLHLTATYSDDGYESPSLNVRVETLPDRAPVFASLYQFVDPTIDLNAFAASGQGFTGLIYVYNPVSGSELQFVCTAA